MNDTTDTPRPGTTHPHLARERALKVLFAADVRGVDPRVLLDTIETQRGALELLDELEPEEEQVAGDEELQLELTRRRRLPLDDYTRSLVRGVAARRPAIDDLLGDVADRWTVSRMPSVDRNLLRLAIYELAVEDTPHAVVIDEAVGLAAGFAGEKARGFVNGVLETVRRRVVAGEVELATDDAPEDEVVAEAPDEASAEEPAAGAEIDASADVVEEVDEAAEQAYDLALDLLSAGYEDDVFAGHDDAAGEDDGEDGLDWADLGADPWGGEDGSDDEALDDALVGTRELEDEDDALW